jgi:hypothetical protein
MSQSAYLWVWNGYNGMARQVVPVASCHYVDIYKGLHSSVDISCL